MKRIGSKSWHRGIFGPAVLFLAGCASHPLVRPLPQPAVRSVPVHVDPSTGERSAVITLLTYNVAGLPWPRRTGTRQAMRRIERAWPAEFADGSPDLLLLQEAFVPSATRLPLRVGYANLVRGPRRSDRADPPPEPPSREFRKGRAFGKGERLGKLTGSGLALATDLEIAAHSNLPFGRSSCAGYDCLANKGAMLVEIAVPGMPEPLFVINTHLNSRSASGVSHERSFYAYRRQLREIEQWLDRVWRGRGPLIWVGDFNAGFDRERFDEKEERLPGELAHRRCVERPERCRVLMSWDSDEPWLDTQDLQGFLSGNRVRVEPIAIAARFDSPFEGRMLSDHDGLEVTWRLSWMPDSSP